MLSIKFNQNEYQKTMNLEAMLSDVKDLVFKNCPQDKIEELERLL